MSVNDLAILYQSKIIRIKNTLESLNETGIKGERYKRRLNEIDNEIKKQIEEYNQAKIDSIIYIKDINTIYNNGIAKLEILESELQKYDSYIKGYHYCEYLDSKINGEKISDEELNEYVNKIINFINAINETDTRDYEEEKEIVEKIYYIAYQVMKLEFTIRGTSKIFEVAKDNSVIESFISNEIIKDINELKEKKKITPLMTESISRIQSQGINYSYLDKILITAIALEDSDSIISKIKINLEELVTQMKNNTSEMKKIIREINSTEKSIKDYKETIHETNKENFIEILKRTVAGLIAAGILFGTYSLGKLAKTTVYKTKKETFSTLTGYKKEEIYEEKVGNEYKSTNLYIYKPYGEKNLDGYYQREYTKYDINNIDDDCITLEDYLKLNLEHAANENEGTDSKKASDMSEEDFYDEIIYEIVKIIQDPNNYQVKFDNETRWIVTIFLSFILEGFYGLLVYILYDNGFFDELSNNDWEKEKIKEELLAIKRKLETFKKLADNNREVKLEFLRLMNNYEEILRNTNHAKKITEGNEILSIPDPQIELDRRIKRLIKTKLKEEN